MANMLKSQLIFNQLMNGKVINRQEIINDCMVVNENFLEIMKNIEEYRLQYQMCGFNFIENENYVYIIDKNRADEPKTDVSMHAQILLVMIGKFLNDNNYSFSKITSIDAGLTLSDIETIQAMSDTEELMERSGMKKDKVLDNIKNILVDRNIMLEKNTSKSFILSEIGIQFYEDLKPMYSQEETEIVGEWGLLTMMKILENCVMPHLAMFPEASYAFKDWIPLNFVDTVKLDNITRVCWHFIMATK